MGLTETKRNMKKIKPDFIAQDAHKKSRVKARWRKPRGSDSKMKQGLKGYRKIVKQGYMTPSKLKHTHLKTGLLTKVIDTKPQIDALDPKEYGLILSKTLGKMKRVDLAKYSKEKGFTILNFIDIDSYIKTFDDEIKKRKEKKEKLAKEKKKKDAEKVKKAEEKKKEDSLAEIVEDEDEKKAREKKEKDKLLISTE